MTLVQRLHPFLADLTPQDIVDLLYVTESSRLEKTCIRNDPNGINVYDTVFVTNNLHIEFADDMLIDLRSLKDAVRFDAALGRLAHSVAMAYEMSREFGLPKSKDLVLHTRANAESNLIARAEQLERDHLLKIGPVDHFPGLVVNYI